MAEVKTAYVTIEVMQKRIKDLEEQGKQDKCTGSPHPSDCLLLGDSNLHSVLRSDLAQDCTVRTIQGKTSICLEVGCLRNLLIPLLPV